MWSTIFMLLIFTALFVLAIDINKNNSRCNDKNNDSFDGNGHYQYKGRGHKSEDVPTLIHRIDWLAKNAYKKSCYTTAYIMAYSILLVFLFIPYAYSGYLVSMWELTIALFAFFILIFSLLNLFEFHTDRYHNYYIRQNIEYISHKLNMDTLNVELKEPKTNFIPHRTKVQDILSK